MNRYSVLFATTAILCAPAAIAGGYVAPVIETAPIVAAAPVQSLNDWTGPYIGANLGWGKGSIETDHKQLKNRGINPDGFSGALRAGYDWQRGQGVFGLGAEYGFGKFKDNLIVSPSNSSDLGETAPFHIKNPAMVFARAGYAFNNNLLGYALLGYTWAKATEPVFGESSFIPTNHNLDGVTIGAGAEYRFHNNWSAYAEYTYTDFGELTLAAEVGVGPVKTDIDLQQIKLGVNYRF